MNGNRGLSKKAAAGKALPSELDKRLKPLDSFAKGAITGIFVQLIMAALFWAHGLSQLLEGIFWSLINIFHVGRLYLWVSWRSEMVTASYRGPRVPGREASSSKVRARATLRDATLDLAHSRSPSRTSKSASERSPALRRARW